VLASLFTNEIESDVVIAPPLLNKTNTDGIPTVVITTLAAVDAFLIINV